MLRSFRETPEVAAVGSKIVLLNCGTRRRGVHELLIRPDIPKLLFIDMECEE
jgi:hypothetical protein